MTLIHGSGGKRHPRLSHKRFGFCYVCMWQNLNHLQRPMTGAEAIISDYHRAKNELPAAFHTFVVVVADESDDTSAEPQHIMDAYGNVHPSK